MTDPQPIVYFPSSHHPIQQKLPALTSLLLVVEELDASELSFKGFDSIISFTEPTKQVNSLTRISRSRATPRDVLELVIESLDSLLQIDLTGLGVHSGRSRLRLMSPHNTLT